MSSKKKKKKIEEVASEEVPEQEPAAEKKPLIELPTDRWDQYWLGSAVAITLIAALLRFIDLGLKPFHHDEGVNGFFLKSLLNDGMYKYDPANYHGPTLYYFAVVFAKLFGLETVPVRVSVAIFGVLMVILTLYLKRYLGKVGSLAAALFLALSPGMVFISRYFIHEIFFVFCSLAIVASLLFYMERRDAGPGAIAWMSSILFTCFVPGAFGLASLITSEGSTMLWTMRVVFLLVDAVLVYFIIKLLLDWQGGRPIYLILASASVSMFFATKETAFITLGTMAIACVCVWLRMQIVASAEKKKAPALILAAAAIGSILAAIVLNNKLPDVGKDIGKWFFELTGAGSADTFTSIFYILLVAGPAVVVYGLFVLDKRYKNDGTDDESGLIQPRFASFRETLGKGNERWLVIGAAAAVFAYLFVEFFSSFFTFADGVKRAFEAYAIWTKTGNRDHTQNGTMAYVRWGMQLEAPIFIASLLGTIIALVKGKHKFAIFTAFWALGLFAAYTIIPYKTPWLALSFLLPMCLIGGYAVNEMLRSKQQAITVTGGILTAVACAILAMQTYDLNFINYDDNSKAYVYAHTRRDIFQLMKQVEHYAQKSGKGYDATIEIVTPDYWPMTWYFNNYTRAFFHGHIVDATTSEMILAKKKDQDQIINQKYADNYKLVGVYGLRPGVDLMLLVRKDLAESDTKDLDKIYEIPGTP